MQHVEGGWPSEVDVDDPGALERFRKKREKGTMQKSGAIIEPLGQSVRKLSPGLVSAVKQNNTIDIYEEYFSGYSTCFIYKMIEKLNAVPFCVYTAFLTCVHTHTHTHGCTRARANTFACCLLFAFLLHRTFDGPCIRASVRKGSRRFSGCVLSLTIVEQC